MKLAKTFSACVFGLLLATLLGRAADAIVIASDNAADAAYAANATDGAWQGQNPGTGENPPGDDNGGFGFLPWDFSGGAHMPEGPYGNLNHFIAGVDFPTTAFNDLGVSAFGLGNMPAAFFGMTTTASRPFAEPLQAGDIFSADIDTPAFYDDYYDDFGGGGFPFAIIGFSDSTGAETFNIEAGSSDTFGDFPWRYDDGTITNGDFGVDAGGSSIAPTASSDGSSFSLEVLSSTTGRFTFDGVSLDITFMAGVPQSVFFILFDNNAEDDDMGDPTGEHAFHFNNLEIERPAAGVLGDYNGNGTVDAADYVTWRDGGPLMNEGASTGVVDQEDYDFWRSRFGATSGSGSGLSSTAAVPEPATALSLIAGLTLLLTMATGRGRARR